MRLPLAATLLALLATAAPAQPADPAARIRQQVEAIAAGDSIAARREPILARLRAIGLAPMLVPFDPPGGSGTTRRGTNIVASIPARAGGAGRAETLLLSAHYDRVAQGRGVIDNAAGVATVLELAQALARAPLARYTVQLAFFDEEEDGLLGSRALVADSLKTPLPAIDLNFDIFGYGNAFWIGAVDTLGPLPRALVDAARQAGLEAVVGPMYPPSDHLSFRKSHTRAYAITLIDRPEIDAVLSELRPGATPPAAPPKILTIIHSDGDTMDKLDPAAIARGVQAVERAIRAFDAAPR